MVRTAVDLNKRFQARSGTMDVKGPWLALHYFVSPSIP